MKLVAAIGITALGRAGMLARLKLEGALGPLADTTLGSAASFFAEHHTGDRTTRWFGMPRPAVSISAAEIAPGVTVRIMENIPDSIWLKGPGAAVAMARRSERRFHGQGLPTLPAPWLAAIIAAKVSK